MPPAVQPLVLVANADKWLAESLESVLAQGGYRVLAIDKRPQIVEQARRQRPDAILLDMALDRRSTERHGMALACAVCRPTDGSGALTGAAADKLALAVKRAGRISDAVGRTGPAEFTVFAPATDETGAEALVQRITDAVSRSAAIRLKAGISAAPARPAPPRGRTAPAPHLASPSDLFDRAREELR